MDPYRDPTTGVWHPTTAASDVVGIVPQLHGSLLISPHSNVDPDRDPTTAVLVPMGIVPQLYGSLYGFVLELYGSVSGFYHNCMDPYRDRTTVV